MAHISERAPWLYEWMSELVQEHLIALVDYWPVQVGTSFDMSNGVQDFLRRSRQQLGPASVIE